MEVANTLTYYDTATIVTVKSFIVQAPVDNALNIPSWLFIVTIVSYDCKMFSALSTGHFLKVFSSGGHFNYSKFPGE